MASTNSSRFLPIVVVIIIALVGVGGFMATQVGLPDGKGGKAIFDLETARLKTVMIDADLPSDTLSTLAINSADIKDKFKGVDETITAQQRQMREMAETLKSLNATNQALRDQLDTQNSKMSAMESAVNTQTLDASNLKDEIMQGLRDNFSHLMPEGVTVPDPNTKDYPVSVEPIMQKKPANSTTRIRSYGLQKQSDKQSANDAESDALKSSSNHFSQDGTAPQKLPTGSAYRYPEKSVDRYANYRPNSGLKAPPEITVDPRFTIPPDAVLNDSVTITALVGRIPRDGDVSDPAPFKVAIGGENLAANGFRLPGIDGMIMSGYVYGDAVRKCVYTKIKRATYIFEDGRILSLPNQNSRQKNSVIGYLTDPYGDPCIKGRYLTNSNAQIKNSIFANMAAGAANAFAATQTTTLTNGQGGASTAVTGDPNKYILGSAISTGASSVANYLLKQSFDQWDQVVVPVGQTVTIHIDVPLELDNKSTLRKLVYGNENSLLGLTD